MPQKKKLSPLVVGVSGAIGGATEALINWPSEVIKTELQMQSRANPLYKGYIDCARKKIASQGVVSLYRGLVPVVLGSLPKAGVRFCGKEYYSTKVFSSKDGTLSSMGSLGAGLCAGATEAVLVVTPMETLKTRLINANKPFISGTLNLIKAEGVGAMYKGVVPTILKQSLNQGTRFFVYDSVINSVCSITGADKPGAKESISSGMLAGAASVLVNQPMDTVKTLMQSTESTKYKGTVDCFRTLVRTEGIGAVYRGLVPRLARVCPGTGIIFGVVNAVNPIVSDAFQKNSSD